MSSSVRVVLQPDRHAQMHPKRQCTSSRSVRINTSSMSYEGDHSIQLLSGAEEESKFLLTIVSSLQLEQCHFHGRT
jgi:hypothetical protein